MPPPETQQSADAARFYVEAIGATGLFIGGLLAAEKVIVWGLNRFDRSKPVSQSEVAHQPAGAEMVQQVLSRVRTDGDAEWSAMMADASEKCPYLNGELET